MDAAHRRGVLRARLPLRAVPHPRVLKRNQGGSGRAGRLHPSEQHQFTGVWVIRDARIVAGQGCLAGDHWAPTIRLPDPAIAQGTMVGSSEEDELVKTGVMGHRRAGSGARKPALATRRNLHASRMAPSAAAGKAARWGGGDSLAR